MTELDAIEFIKESMERSKARMAQLEATIGELEIRIAELKAENARFRGAETADAFVERLVKTTKKMYRMNRKQADSIRQVLLTLNREKEQQELADWMDKKPVKKPGVKRLVQNNVNSQVFYGEVTESEFNRTGRNGKRK